jgi:chromosome segregation ATPase
MNEDSTSEQVDFLRRVIHDLGLQLEARQEYLEKAQAECDIAIKKLADRREQFEAEESRLQKRLEARAVAFDSLKIAHGKVCAENIRLENENARLRDAARRASPVTEGHWWREYLALKDRVQEAIDGKH